jgi:RES domain-containing protein
MSFTIWRICKTKYAETAFDGEGSGRYPGRWNSRGTRIVYCASCPSLAILEILAHLDGDSSLLFNAYCLIPAECPEGGVLSIGQLPDDWRESPPPASTRAIGDAWVEDRSSLVHAVPSVLAPVDQIFLVNPEHPAFDQMVIGAPQPLELDPRLLGSE